MSTYWHKPLESCKFKNDYFFDLMKMGVKCNPAVLVRHACVKDARPSTKTVLLNAGYFMKFKC